MSKEVVLDEIYNQALRHIFQLMEHSQSGRRFVIWQCKSAKSDASFVFQSVLEEDSIYDVKDVIPIQLVISWMPNVNDAGRILRVLVNVALEHYKKTHVSSNTGSKLQSPGVG